MDTVSPKKISAVKEKMKVLGIKEKDILEKFVRSSGPGGQKVNKTSSCVYIKHLPTGLQVKCGRHRSQTLNRFMARRILVDKIEQMVLKKESEKQKQIEKIKRQKRKRSKRAKEKILKAKSITSQKKRLRKVSPEDLDE